MSTFTAIENAIAWTAEHPRDDYAAARFGHHYAYLEKETTDV